MDLICATRGENGSRVDVPEDVETGVAREAELRAAAAILGIRGIHFLGYRDGELQNIDPGEVTEKVLEIMRQAEPEVVITFGPDGISGHPDHIAIGDAATEAFRRLASEGRGPRKLYYVTVPRSVLPDAEFGVTTRPDEEVTTAIDISAYLERKIQAISSHRSQQDAREFVAMLKQAPIFGFAAKEHLYLANYRPPAKETDLFR